MQTHIYLDHKTTLRPGDKMHYTKNYVVLECPFCFHRFRRVKNKLSTCPKCNTCFTSRDLRSKAEEANFLKFKGMTTPEGRKWGYKKKFKFHRASLFLNAKRKNLSCR